MYVSFGHKLMQSQTGDNARIATIHVCLGLNVCRDKEGTMQE